MSSYSVLHNAEFDANFACCGGCSSSKRADGPLKLATGSKVFIWDVKLKIDPAPVCLTTFPYDPGLSEQVGERRVRSGRLVGTSYPIDHDYDSLCCEQRGSCLALDEDASGKCTCIKRWGFSGDHCELSSTYSGFRLSLPGCTNVWYQLTPICYHVYLVYEAAVINNTKLFPVATNLSDIKVLLPDLRQYLLTFDHEKAIKASTLNPISKDSLLGVLETGSYRQYAWTTSGYFLAMALLFALVFLFQVCWHVCCFSWGCRKRDPTKQPKIYSQLTKLFWGMLMCVFLCAGAVASVLAFLTINSKIAPVSESIGAQLQSTLITDMTEFQTAFLRPLNDLLTVETKPSTLSPLLSLPGLQDAAIAQMAPHTFLENQTYDSDQLRKPVFAILEQLTNYTSLFPTTTISSQADCSNLTISPNVAIRMTIGATTGCFRCKTCSTILDLVETSSDLWKRNPLQVQMDLLIAQHQLQDFGVTKATLEPAIAQFRDRVNASCTVFTQRAMELAVEYEKLRTEVYTVAFFGSLALIGLSGLATLLAIAGFSHGITTNKRQLPRAMCFIAELAFILAVVLAGVLYTTAMMAHDGITTLQLFNASTTPFFASDQVAMDVHNLLFAVNLVSVSATETTLAFADTLRVPPHPTPSTDDPVRFDIQSLYLSVFADLFALENLTKVTESAIVELFGWDEAFVTTQHDLLLGVAFGNASVASPYDQPIHEELLNSTAMRLLDPNNDTQMATSNDLLEIRRVFNESWRAMDDRGVHQNDLIAVQWQFVAQLYLQRLLLVQYASKVTGIISSIRPLLGTGTHALELSIAEASM